MYHRSWDIREPVEIRILPDCIEIIIQGGPDRSVKLDEMQKGIIRNKRYRNRRIGDFLKELDMTEGRGTGIPIIRREMKKNGSPEPRFETDDNYSYFITTLPIHPAFLETDETINKSLNETINRPINGPINSPLSNIKLSIESYEKTTLTINRLLPLYPCIRRKEHNAEGCNRHHLHREVLKKL